MQSVHMMTPYRLTRAALPGMLQRKRGVIINVSSLASYIYLPGSVNYSATKAYLRVFSETLATELKGTGIKIQALCPGFTHTEFHSVGNLKDFDQSLISDGLWMFVDDVVIESLNSLQKNKIVVIPGFKNRMAKVFYELPLIGTLIKNFLFQKLKKIIK